MCIDVMVRCQKGFALTKFTAVDAANPAGYGGGGGYQGGGGEFCARLVFCNNLSNIRQIWDGISVLLQTWSANQPSHSRQNRYDTYKDRSKMYGMNMRMLAAQRLQQCCSSAMIK
jgi:hypothetical protein